MILNDKKIAELARNSLMIEPYEPSLISKVPIKNVQYKDDTQVYKKVLSYGQSSFGYDLRVSSEFKIFTNVYSTVVDPKNFDDNSFIDTEGDCCVIPPNSFALGRSVERIKMPDDVFAICVGKSTMARCGIVVNVTPIEPGWEGYITLEFSNTTPLPARIYANEGCAQLVFFQGERPLINYRDRDGKYQNQVGVVTPRLSK